MNRLPKEIHYIIASYVVSPTYRLVGSLEDAIHWNGLCLNPHPGIIPLIDAYFERCLTIESYLPWSMLLRLHSNPTARSLVKKYEYFFLKLRAKGPAFIETIDDYPYAICSVTEAIKAIKNNTFIISQWAPYLVEFIYESPEIFTVDKMATKAAINEFVASLSQKKLKCSKTNRIVASNHV